MSFEDAGVTTGEGSADAGAKRLAEEILETPRSGVELVPAGWSLTGFSQVNTADVWLLRDMLAAAGLFDRYGLILLDTGGRTGALVTPTMYAADWPTR